MSSSSAESVDVDSSAASVVYQQDPLMRFLTRLFPVLPLVQSYINISELRPLVYLGLFVHSVQQMALVINPHFDDIWHYILGGSVSRSFYAFLLPIYDPVLIGEPQSIYTLLASAWSYWIIGAVPLLSCVYLGIMGTSIEKANSAFVTVNRLVLRSLARWLWMPSILALSSSVLCSSGRMTSSFFQSGEEGVCWGSVHIASLTAAALCVFTTFPIVYVSYLCDYPLHSSSQHPLARRNNVLTIAEFQLDFILTFLFVVLGANGYRGAFSFVLSLSHVWLAAAYAIILPFHDIQMNKMFCAKHALLFCVSIWSATSSFHFEFRHTAVGPILFFSTFLPSILVGYVCGGVRVNAKYLHALRKCSVDGNVFSVQFLSSEYGVDDEIAECNAAGQRREVGAVPKSSILHMNRFPQGLQHDTLFTFPPFSNLNARIFEAVSRSAATPGFGSSRRFSATPNDTFNDSNAGCGIQKSCRLLLPYVTSTVFPSDVDLAASLVSQCNRCLNRPPTPDMLVLATHIFARGLVRFQNSPEVALSFASFIADYIPAMAALGIELVNKIPCMNADISQQFRAAQIGYALRRALGIRNMSHMYHAIAARTTHKQVLKHMHIFWNRLTEPSINIASVAAVADEITKSRRLATQLFRQAVQSHSIADPRFVHRVGEYLRDVLLDSDKAAECFAEAQEIHDSRQRRVMKGTKQITLIETDMETLAQRLLSLLNVRSETANVGTSTRLVRLLVAGVSAVFLFLMFAVGSLLYIEVTLSAFVTSIREHLAFNANARGAAIQFVAELYSLSTLSEAERSIRASKVLSVYSDTFFSETRSLATQTVLSERHDYILNQRSIAAGSSLQLPRFLVYDDVFKWTVSNGARGVSLLELISSFSSSMLTIVSNKAAPNATAAEDLYLRRFIGTFEEAMSEHATVLRAAFDETHSQYLMLFVGSFLAAFLVVGILYVTVVFSLQRFAQERIFTFQLITLIPFETLERLSSETKEKVTAIDLELRKNDSDQQNIDEEEYEENSEGSPDPAGFSHHVVQEKPLFIEAPTESLQSCLKGSRGAHSKTKTKKVTFGVVIVFGDSNKAPESSGLPQKAVVEADGEEHRRKRIEMFSTTPVTFLSAAIVIMSLLYLSSAVLHGVSFIRFEAFDDSSKIRLNEVSHLSEMNRTWTAVAENAATYVAKGDITELVSFFNNLRHSNTLLNAVSGFGLGSFSAFADQMLLIRNVFTAGADAFLDGLTIAAGFRNVTLDAFPTLEARMRRMSKDLSEIQLKYPKTYDYAVQTRNASEIPFNLHLSSLIIAEAFVTTTSARFVLRDAFNALKISESDRTASLSPHPLLLSALFVHVFAAVVAVFAFMISRKISSFPRGSLNPNWFILNIVFHLVPVFVVGYIVLNFSLHSTMDGMIDAFSSQHSLIATLEDHILQYRIFSLSGSPDVLGNIEPTEFTKLLREITAMMTDPTALVSTVRSFTDLHAQLIISLALTVSEFKIIPRRVETTQLLSSVFWNFSTEKGLDDLSLRFFPDIKPGDSQSSWYSNSTFDLSNGAIGHRNISTTLTFSDHQRKLLATIGDFFESQVISETSVSYERLDRAVYDSRLLVIISCLLLLLPLSTIGVLIAHVSLSVYARSGFGAKTDSDFYRDLIVRVRWSLIGVAFLLTSVLTIGVLSMQNNRDVISIESLADNVNIRTQYTILQVKESTANITSSSLLMPLSGPMEISAAVSALDASIKTLTRGSANSVFGFSSIFDAGILGSSNVDDVALSVKKFLPDSCERFADASTASLINTASGRISSLFLDSSALLLRFVSFQRMIGNFTASFEFGTTLSNMVDASSNFSEISTPKMISLLRTLSESFSAFLNTWSIAVVVLSALLIGSIAVSYAFIVVPMTLVLLDEADNAKLLLRMIPTSAREQVPAIAEFIETGKIDNAAELKRKFEASERLLQNILPTKISKRLKNGETFIADAHACITMLFTDFVGFTKRSSTMQAAEIVDFLNEVFLEFDTITEKLELEKIKTIGDAYFMAGGLDHRIADHAMRVVEAGLHFFVALEEHNDRHPSRLPLQMRVGVHTGPAVAGVIGTKKVAYDMWGENVEIANAMESTGVPGFVHISEMTACQVEGFYVLEHRGDLPREKEHIPDNMPETFIVTGRLRPTPYQHIVRPRIILQHSL